MRKPQMYSGGRCLWEYKRGMMEVQLCLVPFRFRMLLNKTLNRPSISSDVVWWGKLWSAAFYGLVFPQRIHYDKCDTQEKKKKNWKVNASLGIWNGVDCLFYFLKTCISALVSVWNVKPAILLTHRVLILLFRDSMKNGATHPGNQTITHVCHWYHQQPDITEPFLWSLSNQFDDFFWQGEIISDNDRPP